MKPAALILAIPALLMIAAAAVVAAPSTRPDQLAFPPLDLQFPEVAELRSGNGMTIYLKEDGELPLVNVTIMVRGGSIHDPLEKTGLSQLFAQTLETGGAGELTPRQLEEELDNMAAQLAVSSQSYSYQIELSVHQRDLRRGMEILSYLLRRPRFDPERLELARRSLLEEIHRKNDHPGSIAGRFLAQAVNPGHPFGVEPVAADIERLTVDDLAALHRQFFHPSQLWWAVSGAIDEQDFAAELERLFGDWQTAPVPPPALPALPEAAGGRVMLIDKKLPQATVLLGHRGIGKDNPDALAVRVANHILGGGGFNSRLMREIRSNRGLVYSIYSQFQPGRYLPELFVVSGETRTDSAVAVVEAVREMIAEMIAGPVTEAELDLARNSLVNSFIFAFENTHAVVTQKARLDFYGYPADYLETYQPQLQALTVAEIQRVARTYLHPDALHVVLVGDSDILARDLARLGHAVELLDLDQTR